MHFGKGTGIPRGLWEAASAVWASVSPFSKWGPLSMYQAQVLSISSCYIPVTLHSTGPEAEVVLTPTVN